MKEATKAGISAAAALVLGAGLAWAGSANTTEWRGVAIFPLLIGEIYLIQILAFIPSWVLKSEKGFDLTGGITAVSVAATALLLTGKTDLRSVWLTAMMMLWALRLSSFLFLRVKKAGKDGRFDEFKTSSIRFLNVWLLQGLWLSFTLGASLGAVTAESVRTPGLLFLLGAAVWVKGFVFETTADLQKTRFRARPENKGRFISTGLWSLSRHPNYFGEILIWLGAALCALRVLKGPALILLLSPLFVTLLLTRISGIPMLEKRGDEKWGGDPEYEAYKKRTPVLIPRIPFFRKAP